MGVMLSICAEATGQKAVLQTFSAALYQSDAYSNRRTLLLCFMSNNIALSDVGG